MTRPLEFTLPADAAASEPPEGRGTRRDDVRLLVASPGVVEHARFGHLPRLLRPGDLLVVNTSATLPAAVDGYRLDGSPLVVHFSTGLADPDDGRWLVEVRPAVRAIGPVVGLRAGERIALAGGVTVVLQEPRPVDAWTPRLWVARVDPGRDVAAFLSRYGRPIRYSYVPDAWPLDDYQTVFARRPGSAEMPSAARPFTPELVTSLVAHGVVITPVTLQTGVSSLEAGESPLPERFDVPTATAELVNLTRAAGRDVIAVGTTTTRALESVAAVDGTVVPGRGWTELVLDLSRPARAVTGLITGWHAPGASHLALLDAVVGRDLVVRAYEEALRHRYRWHEFGDSCLLRTHRDMPIAMATHSRRRPRVAVAAGVGRDGNGGGVTRGDGRVRVCVPVTADGQVDPRWGRADRVAVATVINGDVRDWKEFDVSWGTLHDQGTEGAHHARIARFLLDNQVEAVAVHHVGPGMERMLGSMSIRLVSELSGDATSAARAAASVVASPVEDR